MARMDIDTLLAQARRWHQHLSAGGSLTPTDLAWLIERLEALQTARRQADSTPANTSC